MSTVPAAGTQPQREREQQGFKRRPPCRSRRSRQARYFVQVLRYMNGFQHKKEAWHLQKLIPGGMGRIVNILDLNVGMAGRKMATDRANRDGIPQLVFPLQRWSLIHGGATPHLMSLFCIW